MDGEVGPVVGSQGLQSWPEALEERVLLGNRSSCRNLCPLGQPATCLQEPQLGEAQ